MTEVIFSFDTEDFTSNVSADAIVREAEILHSEGVRGGFCIVGLLADQLVKWGRADVRRALEGHDILSHSYGHSLHPTLCEYTDLEDYEEAAERLQREEGEALQKLQAFLQMPMKEEEAFDGTTEKKAVRILGACPPGNQKSYVAMYGYADFGLPIYADTVCDTPDGRGSFYCNMFQTKYTFCMENFFKDASEEFMKQTLDELAQNKRVICYTHPNMALYSIHWDLVNYYKENKYPFGEWKEAPRRTKEESEAYFDAIRRFIRLIKADPRFQISSYSQLVEKLDAEPVRKLTIEDLPGLKKQLAENFGPIEHPSYCVADVFLACKEFLLGAKEHCCGKVYGFLEQPVGIRESVRLTKEEMIASAEAMNTEKFLPAQIMVGEQEVGPGDWLRAALEILTGAEIAEVLPGEQLPGLDELPELKNVRLVGWVQGDDMKDLYLSDRLRLQIWTLRHLEE